ncbi:hypothetical protein VNI00_012599 [Paramarasmius palmivorus]|uniref:Uncharacterized protein n=1 Tax=Paramarasmius palmivorus TaxID=297713 RepID=A0AAW0C709_9AGAR
MARIPSPGEHSGYSSDDGSLDEFIQSVLDEPCSDVESTATREPPLHPDYYASDEDDILDAFVRQSVQHPSPDSPSPLPRVAYMTEKHRLCQDNTRSKILRSTTATERAIGAKAQSRPIRDALVGPYRTSLDSIEAQPGKTSGVKHIVREVSKEGKEGARRLRPLIMPCLVDNARVLKRSRTNDTIGT